MKIDFLETLKDMEATHAVHAMIWAPMNTTVLGHYDGRAAVLMQLRFDGCLGFPGGIVDGKVRGVDPEDAMNAVVESLNRELEEEVNIDLEVMKVTKDQYLYTQRHVGSKNMISHFFTMEVNMTQFKQMERDALAAPDFGDEVMGHVRVPLYKMEDGDRGFPAFLKNNFVGPAKYQLYRGLISNKIFTLGEIVEMEPDFVY